MTKTENAMWMCVTDVDYTHSISWKIDFHLDIVIVDVVLIVVFPFYHMSFYFSPICHHVFPVSGSFVFPISFSSTYSLWYYYFRCALVCHSSSLSLSANTHVRHTKTFDWLLIFYHFVCLTPRGHTIDFDEREPRKKEEEKESSDSSTTFSFNVCTQCVWVARKMPFGCLSHYYFRCGVDDCAEQFTSWAKKKKKKKDEIHRQKIRRLNHVEVFFSFLLIIWRNFRREQKERKLWNRKKIQCSAFSFGNSTFPSKVDWAMCLFHGAKMISNRI